jgi:hypothetical protein
MRKRWLSALFHAGGLLVILGGWMTSRNATSFTARAYGVPLSVAETPEEEAEIRALRSFRLEGDEKSIFVDTFELAEKALTWIQEAEQNEICI